MSKRLKKLKNLFFGRTYSIKHNFARLFIINIVNAGWVLNQFVVGIILGEAAYGVFSLLIYTAMLVTYPITTGASSGIRRYVPEHDEDKSLKNAMSSNFIFLIGIFLSIIIGVFVFALNLVSPDVGAYLCVSYSVSYSLLYYLRRIATSIGRSNWGILAEGIPRLIFFALTLVVYFYPAIFTIKTLVLIDMGLRFVSGGLLFFFLFRKNKLSEIFWNYDWKLIKRVSIFAFFCIIGSLSNELMRYLTVPLVNKYIPGEALGRYSMALTLSQFVSVMSIALGGSIIAKISADINTYDKKPDSETLSRTISLGYKLIIPASVIITSLIAISDPLAILGTDYRGIPIVFSLLTMYQVILLINTPLAALQTGTYYIKQSTLFGIISAAVTGIFWVFTLQRWELIGLTTGWIAGSLSYFLLSFIFVIRKFKLKIDIKNLHLLIHFVFYIIILVVPMQNMVKWILFAIYSVIAITYIVFVIRKYLRRNKDNNQHEDEISNQSESE